MLEVQNAPQLFNLEEPIDLRSTSKERLQTLLTGITLILLTFIVGLKCNEPVERINNAVIALQVELLPKTGLSPLPIIVEVDEQSLNAYGQWPWPRYQVAHLLETIQRGGPAAVGVDALFIEHDRTSPSVIHDTLARDFKQQLSLATINKSLWDYDALLGNTLKTGPFVLGYLFTFDQSSAHECHPQSASGVWFSVTGKNTTFPHLPNALSVLCNIPLLQQAATTSGFINAAPDSDGIYRKTPLVISYKGKIYPSLALQTYLTAQGFDHFLLSPSETGLTMQVGGMEIPLDNSGNLLLRFPTFGQRFEKISAVEVLSGKLEPNSLKGKIVFVGFSAAGLHEFRPTPFSSQFLGIEFHATVVDNLSRHKFLQRPDYAQILELGVAALLGITLMLVLAEADPYTMALIPVFMIALLVVMSQLLLAHTGIVISSAIPVMMILQSFLIIAVLKFAHEHYFARQMALMIANAHEGIVESLNSMAESRDPETGAHIKRTQNYVKALANQLQNHPKYKKQLTKNVIELLFKAAPLHDLGKVGIRDHILLKPGRLSAKEFEIMKSHPQIGAKIIQAVAQQSGLNAFMQLAHQICLYHHEKWDGTGYPYELEKEAIPLAARLMAIADVYDALICKRVYKTAFSHNQAVAHIINGKNSHFDPLIVDAFVAIQFKFRDIALQFLDTHEQQQTLLNDEN